MLYVCDADRSAAFFREVLGFREVTRLPGGVFLQAPGSTNDHDLGLFSMGAGAGPADAGRSTVGLYHLAWEVPTLADLRELSERLTAAGALSGRSDHGTTKSLYAVDPDGLALEVCWIVPADRLSPEDEISTCPLDLDAEMARYGEATVGGR